MESKLVGASETKEGAVDTFEGDGKVVVKKGDEPVFLGIAFSVRAALDAEAHAAWQRATGVALKLNGAVCVAPDGLNGAMTGPPVACQTYAKELRKTLAPARVTVRAIRPVKFEEPALDVSVVRAVEDWPLRVDEFFGFDASVEAPAAEEGAVSDAPWHPPLALPGQRAIQVEVVPQVTPAALMA